MDYRPVSFYAEPITPLFDKAPMLSKKPPCPQAFIWRGHQYGVVEICLEWVDYTRRGRMARNMQPQHATAASRRGSWGVGRFHFVVRVHNGHFYHIYYDRAPKDVDTRKGSWIMYAEVNPEATGQDPVVFLPGP